MKTAKSAHPIAKQFGSFVRDRRISLGLSRAELAQRLGLILGSHISHVERGETLISPGALVDWARALEVDTAALMQVLGADRNDDTLSIDRAAASNCPPQITLA